jgi:hypothetical protein
VTDHSLLRYVSIERDKFRKPTSHNRPLSHDYEYIGLVGEDAFGIVFGHSINLSLNRNGDGGFDYYCGRWRVDVKTLKKPKYLLVEKDCCKADIYVLACYSEKTDSAMLIGWEFGKVMKAIPPFDTGRGVINHAKFIKYLMPMSRLHKLLGDLR